MYPFSAAGGAGGGENISAPKLPPLFRREGGSGLWTYADKYRRDDIGGGGYLFPSSF